MDRTSRLRNTQKVRFCHVNLGLEWLPQGLTVVQDQHPSGQICKKSENGDQILDGCAKISAAETSCPDAIQHLYQSHPSFLHRNNVIPVLAMVCTLVYITMKQISHLQCRFDKIHLLTIDKHLQNV